MCCRRRYVRPGRRVIRKVRRNFSRDSARFPCESTRGNLQVEEDPAAFNAYVEQAQFEGLSLKLIGAGHDVVVGSVERLTKLSPL